MEAGLKLVVMGGSWGGIKASLAVLEGLPADFSIPILLVLHRLRNQEGSLQELFDKKLRLRVLEVEDKEPLLPGHVYLAPSNYHVLIERDHTCSLDDSELENYSRPAIDVTFTSAADVFAENTVGVLLSGASRDGSSGLSYIFDNGGIAIAQDPAEAEVAVMPQAAVDRVPGCKVMNVARIKEFLLSLHEH
ncbi:CheB methylesterase [Pontibacter mucosus]|uniref:protein-glutamate methylesterase n=1 Tax=Pontibacter mucosus TaxID=1649266 RepID=A0A2T5YPA4_9BACT|nr:chemotaxis protein CheB [Pontibacter mucosus]PTX21130.1 CheB methylesterase [Pontibacter mucosus]